MRKPGLHKSILSVVALVGMLVLALVLPISRAQQPLGGKIKNFTAGSDFYPPPHQAQMKALLQGAEAQLQASQLVAVTQLKLQTFRQDGLRELIVQAPECLYDAEQRQASSAGPLRVQSGNEKMSIEGEGFLFRQTNSSLIISNQVHTVIEPGAMQQSDTSARTNATAKEIGGFDIVSERFRYEAQPGLGIYEENVRVTGTNLSLTSGRLSFLVPMSDRQLESITAEQNVVADYEDIHATGERIQYEARTQALRLSGEPTWRAGERSGSGDELFIDATNRFFRAMGNARLTLAGHKTRAIGFKPGRSSTDPLAAGSTNQLIEVLCDSYELRTNSAAFAGAVRVAQSIAGDPQGTLRCQALRVGFAGTNELQSLIAEDQVVIEQQDNRMTAGRAVYEGQLLQLTNDPAWRAGAREGAGERIQVDIARDEMAVVGKAWMRLPGEELGSMSASTSTKTNAAEPQARQFALISADQYRLAPQRARFEGNVRLDHPQLQMRCETVDAEFPSADGVGGRMVAEKSVVFEVKDTEGAGGQIHGTSQTAIYRSQAVGDVTNRVLELTGNPVLETTNGVLKNKVIMLDLANRKLIAPGRFHMRGFAEAGVTNTFRLPRSSP